MARQWWQNRVSPRMHRMWRSFFAVLAMGALIASGYLGLMGGTVQAASVYSVIWSEVNWNGPGIDVYLYNGQQVSGDSFGWVHINFMHDLTDTTAAVVKDAVQEPNQYNSIDVNGVQYWYFAMDYSPVGDPAAIVTVMVVCQVINGEWAVKTSYPMLEGVTRSGITSNTDITLGTWVYNGSTKTIFPSWLDNANDFT